MTGAVGMITTPEQCEEIVRLGEGGHRAARARIPARPVFRGPRVEGAGRGVQAAEAVSARVVAAQAGSHARGLRLMHPTARARFDYGAFGDGVGGIRDDQVAGIEAGGDFDFRAEVLADSDGVEVDDVVGADDGHARARFAHDDRVAGDAQGGLRLRRSRCAPARTCRGRGRRRDWASAGSPAWRAKLGRARWRCR